MDNVERQIAEFLDEIVANVKKERVKRGVSQLALAGILGHKSPNYIAKIETRKHGVSAFSSVWVELGAFGVAERKSMVLSKNFKFYKVLKSLWEFYLLIRVQSVLNFILTFISFFDFLVMRFTEQLAYYHSFQSPYLWALWRINQR